jgi:hypothetical protein
LDCYTVLPNTPTYMEAWLPPQVWSNQFKLQVVAKDPAVDIYLDACWTYYPVFGEGIPFMHTAPTPMVCFHDSITVIQPSSMEDGSIDISILEGNPPYSILWDDGSTDFFRTGLGAGAYAFHITDGVGCVGSDTIVLDLVTHLGEALGGHPLRWSCDAASGDVLLTLSGNQGPCDLTLVDAMGRNLLEAPLPASGLRLASWGSTGPRMAILQFQDRPPLRIRMPVCLTN